MGVTAGSTPSVASLAQAYLDAVRRGEGAAAADRYFHPEIVGEDQRAAVFGWFGLRSRPTGREVAVAFSLLLEQREGKIARYQFLENTFDVGLSFRTGGGWTIRTDGATKTVPAEG